jgi:hypothetical protein
VLKQNAPVKSTSGEGFSFEDKTVAFYVAHLLNGTPPFGIEFGRLVRIDCQVGSQGWELDDLLLTFEAGGQAVRCALSIKSNRQFSSKAAPGDYVEAGWAQLLQVRSKVFNSANDYVGIATAIHSPEVRESLNQLIKLARGQEPKHLHTHVSGGGTISEVSLQIYESMRCPTSIRKSGDETLPGVLLRRMVFREFDFAEAISERESVALSLCEDALIDGGLDGARMLWEALLALANKTRTEGGYVDLPRLLATLRSRFTLRAHPDFEPDWRRARERNRHLLELVDSRLGGVIHIQRTAELAQLSSQLRQHRILIVRGTSGSGKSALTKSWLESQLENGLQTLYIRAEDLQRQADKSAAEILGLRWQLSEFLASSPSPSSVLVIDGLENCYSRESFQAIKDLVAAADLSNTDSLGESLSRAKRRSGHVCKPTSCALQLANLQIPGSCSLAIFPMNNSMR